MGRESTSGKSACESILTNEENGGDVVLCGGIVGHAHVFPKLRFLESDLGWGVVRL